MTGQESYRRDFEPLMPGVHFVPRNDITALEQVVSERTAGIILELVQGEGGIYPMTEEYIRKARELADRYQRDSDFRRDPVRRGAHGHLLRLPVAGSAGDARRDDGGETGGLRTAAGRGGRE